MGGLREREGGGVVRHGIRVVVVVGGGGGVKGSYATILLRGVID